MPVSGVYGAFHETSLESQDRMHRLHVNAIERLTHAALPRMIQRRKGNIINVSSVAGFLAYPFNVSYCATKAWINSFTEGLYIELKAIHSPCGFRRCARGLPIPNSMTGWAWIAARFAQPVDVGGGCGRCFFAQPETG